MWCYKAQSSLEKKSLVLILASQKHLWRKKKAKNISDIPVKAENSCLCLEETQCLFLTLSPQNLSL
jgi:hypothetical protein